MNPQSATIAGSRNPLKYHWIQNPGKHIFKIRLSVRLFTPLLLKRIPTSYLPRILIRIGGDQNIKKERPRASLHSWSALPLETAGFPAGQLQDETTASLIKPFFSGAQIQKEFPLTFRYAFSHLYSFSKPHFISKNASMATFETTLHPRNAIQLVLAQMNALQSILLQTLLRQANFKINFPMAQFF